MNTWVEHNGALEKLFVFKNFTEALDFVNRVGEIAEKMNHHPNITLQNYNEVFIATTTHDAGNRVTKKDHALSEAIDTLTARM